jgi:hypothetical protein
MGQLAQPARVTATGCDRSAVRAAISRHCGNIETFLRAQKRRNVTIEAYAEGLAHRHPPTPEQQVKGSAAYWQWLGSEWNAAIDRSTDVFVSMGFGPGDIDALAKRAWHSDLGTTFLKSLFSNMVSTGVVSALVLAVTIPASFVLGPIPVIALTVFLTIAASVKYGRHAWASGSQMGVQLDKSRNRDGQSRERFGQFANPASTWQALKRESLAELARTGIRFAILTPLQVAAALVTAIGAATTAATVLGLVMGPVGALIGPPTSALAQVASQCINGRRKDRSMAGLFGITLGEDSGAIDFNAETPKRNVQRLCGSALARSARSLANLLSIYFRHFPGEFKDQRGKKTLEKDIQLATNGSLTTSISAVAETASLYAGAGAPFVALAGQVVSTAAGFAYMGTRKTLQSTLKIFDRPGDHAGKTQPTEAHPVATPIGSSIGVASQDYAHVAVRYRSNPSSIRSASTQSESTPARMPVREMSQSRSR